MMSLKDEIIKKAYIKSYKIENSMLKYFITITTKCLVDDVKQRYVYIDENRFRDELRYYKYYGNMDRNTNFLNASIPLILSNNSIEKSTDNVYNLMFKYASFMKCGAYRYGLAAVIYNEVIHAIIEDKGISYEDIFSIIKSKIIEFNPSVDKSETVKFQMYRIGIISSIDNYINGETDEKRDPVIDLFNVLYDIYVEERECCDDGMKSIKNTIMSILDTEEYENNDGFIESMGDYLIKIKNYKLNKKFYEMEANPLGLINLSEGEEFNDPILNRIRILSKTMDGSILNIKIGSKSGEYNFRFMKKA